MPVTNDREGPALLNEKDERPMWETLMPDEQHGRCTTMGCNGRPHARLIAGGVGSDYCVDCAPRIERMRLRSIETNREIDELEGIFGVIIKTK